ncbi:MAG TPA: ABC transporter ATP-binding protein [Ktedonobacterales bacterium]
MSIMPSQPSFPLASGTPASTPGVAPIPPNTGLPFPPPDAAVATWGLTRMFGQRAAVNGLNLVVRRGEFFGFLGPNGAGKSTTIKMMVGLLRPSSGAAFVGGVDVWREPLRAKALIGVLPEQLNLYERLSGREMVEFAGRLYDLPRPEVRRRAGALLDVLGLSGDADKLVVDYSVGMRKKVSLAAALIHRPQVLFLDEPFEGIDPVSSRTIRDILRDLTSAGTTIFFSSHIMEVVERLCTRVGIIDNGQLIADGSLQELRARAGAPGGGDATLEDIFFKVIGANAREGGLDWLE